MIFIRLPPWAALSERGRNGDHVILADLWAISILKLVMWS